MKENFRMKINQRGDYEKDWLIEHGKRIGIDKIIKPNKKIIII